MTFSYSQPPIIPVGVCVKAPSGKEGIISDIADPRLDKLIQCEVDFSGGWVGFFRFSQLEIVY